MPGTRRPGGSITRGRGDCGGTAGCRGEGGGMAAGGDTGAGVATDAVAVGGVGGAVVGGTRTGA